MGPFPPTLLRGGLAVAALAALGLAAALALGLVAPWQLGLHHGPGLGSCLALAALH